ncbi:TetR/AcrR family transcriptional regulator [Paenibacillus thermoaerophilus]|uniref:TetR/AcrR family transcriptional regulator n=1 Tax=Paenibacillus thermoaerophilus TaxID=1215385 RepID=A0ABW2V065_9BACL|nr:TetR/AcrR family transcriptional regulator [Paenibacillus thermoaerophilus]TMV18189.1 TetR/AcrR family transcriptional regulator [Paenibacillus thermoaerophilus]
MMKPRPSRRDAQEVSRVILQTASALFEEHGIEAVSMHQIAKCAGIGQGTLYRRYANKSDLCMDLIQNQFNRFVEGMDDYIERSVGIPPSEKLCELVRRLLALFEKESKLLGAMQIPSKEEQTRFDFYKSAPYLYLHDRIQQLLAECADGLPGYDAAFTAHLLITSLSPHNYIHLRDVYGLSHERIAEKICASFILPLCSPAPHANPRCP